MSATALIDRPSTHGVRRTFAPAGDAIAAPARCVGTRLAQRRIYSAAGEAASLRVHRSADSGRCDALRRHRRRIFAPAGEAAPIAAMRPHRFDVKLPGAAAARRVYGAAGEAPPVRWDVPAVRSDCVSADSVDAHFDLDPAPRQGSPLLRAHCVPAAEALGEHTAALVALPDELGGITAALAAADPATYESEAWAAGIPPAASRRRIARFASLQVSSERAVGRRCRSDNRR